MNNFMFGGKPSAKLNSLDDYQTLLEGLMDQRRYDEVLNTVDFALKRYPRDPMLGYYRICGYFYSHRLREALAAAETAIGYAPNDAPNLVMRGCVNDDLGNTEKALADYNRAIQLEPDFPDAYFERAVLHERRNELEASLKDAEKVVKLDPKYDAGIRLRMELYERLKRYREAIADCDRLIAMGKANSGDYVCKVFCESELNLPPEEILPDAIKATELNLVDPEAWYRRGAVELSAGRWEDCVKSMNRSLQVDQSSVSARSVRGEALWQLGRLDEARCDLDAALAADPADLDALLCRGRLMLDLQKPEDALADLNGYLAKVTDDATAWGARGLAYRMLGRYAEAEDDFAKAVKIAPDYGYGYYMLGDCAANAGDIESARRRVLTATRCEPDNAWYFLTLGILQHQLGEAAESASSFDTARAVAARAGESAEIEGAIAEFLSD